ncbi:hypothetical protein [Haloimpatiens massiliensis]|uniref:hypothetical protein n=1 Tax=Haloimpatiens massiliensis TaxID=1658110 RepID=UPI0011AF6F34|nr:hypothetical protein [Haloimpatiens massiliensis]
MNIDKGIRKQNKSIKRFLFSGCFIFFGALIILISLPKLYTALKISLIFIQMITLIIVVSKVENNYLRYVVNYDKILFKTGILDLTTVMRKNKVLMVHTINEGRDLNIIIIISSKVKKRNFKEVNRKFFDENQDIYKNIHKMKKKKSSEKYYYTVLIGGGFYKYKLLNDIYVNCENAFFSDEAIENVKLYRNIE